MKQSFDTVLKSLHWLVLTLVIIEFVLAWTMPGIRQSGNTAALTDLHFSFGILIFFVVIFRLLWRATHTVPELPSTTPTIMRLASHATHYVLYGILIVLPFLGWTYASTRGATVSFFGIIPLPNLLESGASIGRTLGELHRTLGTLLTFLVGFHVVAALYHHFILKDNILTRMLPEKPVM